MRRIFAVANIAVRNAIRSKVVLSLLFMLLLVLIGLPLTVKGDGTIEGYAQILLRYTLGAAAFLLSLATLWSGCAAVSSDIEARFIQMTVSKPVTRTEVWAGKWLGIMFINFFLLTLAGITCYGLLIWNTGKPEWTTLDRHRLWNEWLVARRVVLPRTPDVRTEAARMVEERVRIDPQVAQLPRGELVQAAEMALLGRAYTVSPGSACKWELEVPELAPGVQSATVRYNYNATVSGSVSVKGLWSVLNEGDTTPTRFELSHVTGAFHEFPIQVQSGRLELEYLNTDERAVTLVFESAPGLQLLVPAGSFESNLVRSLVILLIRLGFLCALGITMGTLFSMPVASFMAMFAMLLILSGGYVESLAAPAFQ